MTKVLVVDDIPDMATLMAGALRDQSYEVFLADNGRSALQVASARNPDVILLDVMMPVMNGIEVLRHLKHDPRLRTIPVIPEDIRRHVFDPFFTTKDVGKGTGQGLTIAHSIIVTKHGGRIRLETEVGRGTTFIVQLPIADRATAEEAGQLETVEATGQQ